MEALLATLALLIVVALALVLLSRTWVRSSKFGGYRATHEPDGTWWTHCEACNWSAAADSWEELFRLTSEFHNSPDAKHRAWVIYSSPTWQR